VAAALWDTPGPAPVAWDEPLPPVNETPADGPVPPPVPPHLAPGDESERLPFSALEDLLRSS
jgi:hypothetical protein